VVVTVVDTVPSGRQRVDARSIGTSFADTVATMAQNIVSKFTT
jgi:hypothetical protein